MSSITIIKGIPSINLAFRVLCLAIFIVKNIPILPPIKDKNNSAASGILCFRVLAASLSVTVINM